MKKSRKLRPGWLMTLLFVSALLVTSSSAFQKNGYGKYNQNKCNHAVGQSIAAADGKQRG